MQLPIKPSTFRIAALVLGVLGLAATIAGYSVFWAVVGAGALFGLGGLLIDYFTGSRLAGGQLPGWALAIGGGIVLFYWSRAFVVEGHAQISVWPLIGQYVAVVLLCWAILLFALPARRDEP
jgi:hypothetical protein